MRGRQLVTPEDADAYITELPKAQQDLEEWQAAVEALVCTENLSSGVVVVKSAKDGV
jgi:hypothetical protein